MLQPFLVVGVGGSGGATLRALHHSILMSLRRVGWEGDMPDAWQFLHFDSPAAPDGAAFPAPFLPRENYLSLVPGGTNYQGVFDIVSSKFGTSGRSNSTEFSPRDELNRVLPDPAHVAVSLSIGAGQYRGIGKAISYSSLGEVAKKARWALGKITSNNSTAQLTTLSKLFGTEGGAKLDTQLIVVSSIAGGSGAGQFLEVTEAVKSALPNTSADHAVSLLYAPDVFSAWGNTGGGMAPNSLYALSETTNAIYTSQPSPAISQLYKNDGLIVSAAEAYKVGAKYNFIVGRTSANVSFNSPFDVYMAMGSFLSTWITNASLQDAIRVDPIGNWSVRATSVLDETGTKSQGEPTPFSSFGFGKVSLGLDQFEDYSAERIARTTIDNLLSRHAQQDPLFQIMNESAWVEKNAREARDDFFADSRLDKQKGAQGFDFYQDLSPAQAQVQALEGQLRDSIFQAASSGMPAGGHAPGVWASIIANTYQNYESRFTQLFSDMVAEKAKNEWVPSAPARITNLVGMTLARSGLPVTVELVELLIKRISVSVGEARSLAVQYKNVGTTLQSRLGAALAPVQTMPKVPIQNPQIQQATREAEVSLQNSFYGIVFETGATLLEDFSANFLAPLHSALEGMKVKLTAASKELNLPDGRPNPYLTWARSVDSTPTRFKPAPNAALLIDHDEYPKEFSKLVTQTFSAVSANHEQALIEELCKGSEFIEGVSVSKKHQWAILSPYTFWVPKERNFQPMQSAPQRASFKTSDEVLDFLSMAENWLEIGGRPFNGFLSQNLVGFLEVSDPILQAERNQAFVNGFAKAAASSDPLVHLNKSLLQATHGAGADDYWTLVSDIPVAVNTPLFGQLKNVLQNTSLWDEGSLKWFKGPTAPSAATTSEVFVVKLLKQPVNPITMGSVVEPIAQEWAKVRNNTSTRQSFMQWRQGRSLSESVPASPLAWQEMLKGWFVARLLNLVTEEVGLASGPKLKIWVDGGKNHVDFPYPLFSPTAATFLDYPAVILQSLKIALLDCYALSSLDPLDPFKTLRHLGGTTAPVELEAWVQEAKTTSPSQPVPDSRAGSSSDSVQERKAKAIAFFREEQEVLRDEMQRLDRHSSSRNYPLVWEIREQIDQALDSAIATVEAIREPRRL